MTLSGTLVAVITLLQVGAGLAYLWQGQWKLAGVWVFVGIANFFMILLDRAQ